MGRSAVGDARRAPRPHDDPGVGPALTITSGILLVHGTVPSGREAGAWSLLLLVLTLVTVLPLLLVLASLPLRLLVSVAVLVCSWAPAPAPTSTVGLPSAPSSTWSVATAATTGDGGRASTAG